MKYTNTNKPLVCMMTNSTCYRNTTTMNVKGVLWHSTGANNTSLKRYVQPSSNDKNYTTLMKKLGKNTYGNDWNHITRQAGVNAWIGKLADGTVTTVQTLPWNFKPWGCGSGSKGSCNNGWIQFEICEDSLKDKKYFETVFEEACQLTAYLCKLYDLDPTGTATFNGVKVPVILCHQDSYRLKLGSNHGDVYTWFNKYGKTMDDVRKRVQEIMKGVDAPKKEEAPSLTPTPVFAPYKVKITTSALNYRAGAGVSYKINGVVHEGDVFTIVEEKKVGTSTWGKLKSGAGWINLHYTKRV